jgi:hypothetical protein
LRQPVYHAGCGDGSHHGAAQTAHLYQVFQRQCHDLVRIHELAALIHCANAVGISIRRQAEIAHPGADGGGQSAQVTRNRFWMNATEAGVHLGADLVYLAAAPLAGRP